MSTGYSTLIRLILILTVTFGWVASAQDTSGVGAVAGRVADPQGTPLAGVTVCTAETTRCVMTAPDGSFQLQDLRAGESALQLQSGGIITPAGTIRVRAGLTTEIEIVAPQLDQARQSITVTAGPFYLPEEIKNSGYLVDGDQVFKSAGTLQDVSRFVQTLPGVAIGSDDFRNDIIVRGGSPLENLFIVDNVEIPNINTFANFASAGGSVSILDPSLIQDATFLTGGFPAPYGTRASSVLQITQREGNRDRIDGRASLYSGGAGLLLSGPVRQGRGSWVVSGRRSLLDAFTKDIGVGGVPILYTFNAKGLYDLSPRDRVWLVNLSAFDDIRLGLTEKNRNDADKEVNNFDIRYGGWRSATGFSWQRLFGIRGVGLLGINHAEASVNSSLRDLVRNGLPPSGVPVDDIIAASPIVYREDSREGETTLKYDLTVETSRLGKVQAGASYKLFRIQYDAASPLGNDTPYASQPGLSPFFLRRDSYSHQQSAYAQFSRSVTSRLSITAGLRADSFGYLRETRLAPRASARYQLAENLFWRTSYGQYYQQPNFLFLAAFDQNRDLVPLRASHFITGLNWTPNPKVRITFEVYRKTYKDYPVASQLPSLSLANVGDTFNVREILFPLVSAGRGRAQGAEFFVETRGLGKWFGQANFSISSTQHAGLDGVSRPGSFDYRRIANITGGYRFNSKWELAARFAYLTGRPFTPYDPVISAEQRRGVYDLSRVNQERLPSYLRLDIRLDRTFFVRDHPVLVFAGVQNVTNRRNVSSPIWNRRTGEVDVNTQLGVFPLVGFEWRF